MIVPIHRWRQNDVPPTHLYASTMYGGKASLAFYNEAHGERNVSMCRCGFVGHDKLKAGVECVGCIWGICYGVVNYAHLGQELLPGTYLELDSPTSEPSALLASQK